MTRVMAETPEVAHCWNFWASCTLGELGENHLGFLFQSGVDLRLGGGVGQLFLRQLQQGQLAVALQALLVLPHGGYVKGFFQLSHTEDGDIQHTFSFLPYTS